MARSIPGQRLLIIATAVLFVLLTGYALYTAFSTPSQEESGARTGDSAETSFIPDRVINVTARQWSFTPDIIRVRQGERIRLRVKSIDVTHGIRIPQLGINEVLSPGEDVTIDFTATTVGIFSFSCSVYCGEGHQAMKGKIIVEPRK